MPPKRGLLASLLIVSPILLLTPYITLRKHYALPTPLIAPFDSFGKAQLSEANILETSRYLSESIGYRTVGTAEHAAGDVWLLNQVEKIRDMCEDAIRKRPDRKLECEVWHQQGSGAHRYVRSAS
jgi:hypothetical protein